MGSRWRLMWPWQALVRPPRTRSTPTSPQAAKSRAAGTRPWGERPDAGADSAATDLIPSRRPKAWRRAPVSLPAKELLKELRHTSCALTPSHDADVALMGERPGGSVEWPLLQRGGRRWQSQKSL